MSKFFKRLQRVYPMLKGWNLRFVNCYGCGVGFCNRANRSLDCSVVGMWDLEQGKRLILHEATHVFTGGYHDRRFWNRYEELLTRWLGSGLDKVEVRWKAECQSFLRRRRVFQTEGEIICLGGEMNEKCERCGRNPEFQPRVKIKKGVTGEMLCQYCRGNDTRHISGIRKMGYIPTVHGRPIDDENEKY